MTKIGHLTYNAQAVVKLRRQLEAEVYRYDNPPCLALEHVEGRLSNFQACLTGHAVDEASDIMTASQKITLQKFSAADLLEDTMNRWEIEKDAYFYGWLTHCEDEELKCKSIQLCVFCLFRTEKNVKIALWP